MDTFMDKLAQKLTAQEIIRGNLAADAEEMDTLKEQVKDYQECIDQVKALSELMERKMNNVPEIDENLDRLRRLKGFRECWTRNFRIPGKVCTRNV